MEWLGSRPCARLSLRVPARASERRSLRSNWPPTSRNRGIRPRRAGRRSQCLLRTARARPWLPGCAAVDGAPGAYRESGCRSHLHEGLAEISRQRLLGRRAAYRDECACGRDDPESNVLHRPRDERAGSLGVPPSPELPREPVHIHIARTAERDLHLAVAQVAEKQREARAGDGSRVLDNSLEILGADVVAVERVSRNGDPGDAIIAIDLERAQRISQQRKATG